jgi:hypothetical protein
MNRLLFGAGLVVFFGCGARTEYFDDVDGAGGRLPGIGGTSAIAGAPHAGGVSNAAGAPHFAGAVGISGGPGVAGGSSVGGAPNIAGATGRGGATNVAGGPSKGGAPNIAGAPNVGGAGIGNAGSGATAGIVEACHAIAGNSCQQCLCSTCSSQILECFSNFGCALILACAQQTGCQGVSCYSAASCKPTIDQFGGLSGKSMKEVLSLLSCSVGSQNSCSCN